MRSDDDLTYKLGDIIKASANVRRCEQEGAPAHVTAEILAALSEAVKAIWASLRGKEGRLRRNLTGKRVDFSGRTIIIRAPKSIAMNLTYTERGWLLFVLPQRLAHIGSSVTPFDIAYLQELGQERTRERDMLCEILGNALTFSTTNDMDGLSSAI